MDTRVSTSSSIPRFLPDVSGGFDFLHTAEAAVCASVRAILSDDPIIADVFQIKSDGKISIRKESRVLSGHFPGMPIVPGVILKRLVRQTSGTDLYHHWSSSRPCRWKTEFLAPVTPEADDISLIMAPGEEVILKGSDGKIFTRSFEVSTKVSPTEVSSESDGRTLSEDGTTHGLLKWNGALYSAVSTLSSENVEKDLFQDGVFRFASAGGPLPQISDRLMGGYFDIPKNFAFVDGHNWSVPIEIVEESVAQILSLAYARSRAFPSVRTPDGSIGEKAKILTFKSSVAEI
jgi:hypothetical protein